MATTSRATYQDVLDAPEHQVAELIDGELFLSPRPGGTHSAVASNLGMVLGPPFHHGRGGPGGWLIIDEPELHLTKDVRVVVPDLAAWRTERMSVVPDGHKFEIVPDWVCEIASPSTTRVDRQKKMPLYASAGVSHFWWISPRMRMLEIFRNVEGRWMLVATHLEGDIIRVEPFGEAELDLALLWSALPSRASEVGGAEYVWY